MSIMCLQLFSVAMNIMMITGFLPPKHGTSWDVDGGRASSMEDGCKYIE
jgi:hypothetical protein